MPIENGVENGRVYVADAKNPAPWPDPTKCPVGTKWHPDWRLAYEADEDEAFALNFSAGAGVGSWGRPIGEGRGRLSLGIPLPKILRPNLEGPREPFREFCVGIEGTGGGLDEGLGLRLIVYRFSVDRNLWAIFRHQGTVPRLEGEALPRLPTDRELGAAFGREDIDPYGVASWMVLALPRRSEVLME